MSLKQQMKTWKIVNSEVKKKKRQSCNTVMYFSIFWMLLMNIRSIGYGVNVLQIGYLTILLQNGTIDLFF